MPQAMHQQTRTLCYVNSNKQLTN